MKCVDADAKPSDFRRPGHMFPAGSKSRRRARAQRAHRGHRRFDAPRGHEAVRAVLRDHARRRHHDAHDRADRSWHGSYDLVIVVHQANCKTAAARHDNHMHERGVRAAAHRVSATFTRARLRERHHRRSSTWRWSRATSATDETCSCRVHSECLTGDVFGSMRCDCGEQLACGAGGTSSAEGRGVLLYMRQEGRGIGLINKLARLRAAGAGHGYRRGQRRAGLRP